MEENERKGKKVWIAVASLLAVLLGAGALYWYFQRPGEIPLPREEGKPEAAVQEKAKEALPPAPPVPAPAPSAGVKPGPAKEAPPPPAVALPVLDQSDDFVRQMMKGLSPHGRIAEWLKMKNLIRVITVVVDNIARGVSPRPHLGFLSPGQAFSVNEKGKKIALDPRSYERYDIFTDAWASLGAARTIQFYEKLKPLFQEAYRELGYPHTDFQDALIQAIRRLLETPVVEREILLREEGQGINYRFVDEELESLGNVQKHLVRMGPKNTRKIQQKLREMALLLGVPERELPQPQLYLPRSR